jgi:hypothetical protein
MVGEGLESATDERRAAVGLHPLEAVARLWFHRF